MASSPKLTKNNHRPAYVTGLGIGLILVAGVILFRLFSDPIKQEVRYALRNTISGEDRNLNPANTDFSLVIDKIGATAPVVESVDPYDSAIYQRALRDGVAHAKGTALPGEGGNIFLFAHSSADLLTAARYNSVFYLIHHLELGDQISVWYQGGERQYTVSAKRLVSASDTQYLTEQTQRETLTLMTCWPPGTTYKRLIVIAQPFDLDVE